MKLGLDVGYGSTKFAAAGVDGSHHAQAFPSLARPADTNESFGTAGHDVLLVEADGAAYCVGREIEVGNEDCLGQLGPQFPYSPEYLSLARGAFYYAYRMTGETTVTELAVGLPVSGYRLVDRRDAPGVAESGAPHLCP